MENNVIHDPTSAIQRFLETKFASDRIEKCIIVIIDLLNLSTFTRIIAGRCGVRNQKLEEAFPYHRPHQKANESRVIFLIITDRYRQLFTMQCRVFHR